MENPISNESIGKRVAALRKKQHLTQAQLADLVGATAKHISEIERGITGISIDMQVKSEMKRKVICILMSSILSLSSAQVQTIFAEEMTITDGLSESENSDVIENENLQIEDQTETVDADNETIPDCIENQEVEVLQNDSEFSDGASENTEGLKEFSEKIRE